MCEGEKRERLRRRRCWNLLQSRGLVRYKCRRNNAGCHYIETRVSTSYAKEFLAVLPGLIVAQIHVGSRRIPHRRVERPLPAVRQGCFCRAATVASSGGSGLMAGASGWCLRHLCSRRLANRGGQVTRWKTWARESSGSRSSESVGGLAQLARGLRRGLGPWEWSVSTGQRRPRAGTLLEMLDGEHRNVLMGEAREGERRA